jgi:hypothetical protein
MGDTFRILTEIEDKDMEQAFNTRDALQYEELLFEQASAAANTGKRKGEGKKVAIGQRVQADDYDGEPNYAHSGIHLGIRSGDQIQWRCADSINFLIDVGPDPELFRVRDKELDDDDKLPKKFLHDKKFDPFVENKSRNRIICVNGAPVLSGPLRLEDNVRLQRYFKFSVTVLGTRITLDPHFEGHDE